MGIWQKVKKNWVVLAICLGIVGLSYVVIFDHYRTFSFHHTSDPVYRLESYILDLKIKNRGIRKSPKNLGVLAIDEKAIQTFGAFPFPRKHYAKAFANLKKLGVKWIAFDAVFAEPQAATLVDLKEQIDAIFGGNSKARRRSYAKIQDSLKNSPSDKIFADSIADFENIVLGYFNYGSKWERDEAMGDGESFESFDRMESSVIEAVDFPEGMTLESYPQLMKAYGLQNNIPEVAAASEHFGFFSNQGDSDAIYRWTTLVTEINGQLLPSLALKVAAEAMDRDIFVLFDEFGVESILLINRENDEDVVEIPTDPQGAGRLLVNHLGPSGAFHHFSLADAYNDSFTEEERENLKGAVLFLGATAIGTNDLRPNPFDPGLDGVENHLATVENIMTGKYYKRDASIYQTELMLVLGVGLLFCPLMMFGSALFSGVSVAAFVAGYIYFDHVFWFSEGTWTYMAIPLAEISVMYLATTLYKFMVEEREKRQVKGAFQHYLSPEVIDQVLDDPDALSLGGKKNELTVFFSDVRSFTTISESLSPEKLCELMNDYFTPMTSIVLKRKGVLDKYIGDAIMAFWGAPIQINDAPDQACMASLEMLMALDRLEAEFKQKGFPKIDIGIGLNTGPMSVGNMGSAERMAYTVMGDSVNLGARLEGLTKEYGIKIMISEFTEAKVTKGLFFTRDLDDIRVKGKNEPVKVFELMRPDFLAEHDDIREFIKIFEKGRLLYRTQHWDGARKAFEDCIAMKPTDRPSALYIERIESYLASPPEENWSGVYTFTHK